MVVVRVDAASIASDASQVAAAASSVLTATTSAGSSLVSYAGMAGIDPMAEEFAQGAKGDGGYDLSAASMMESGITLAQAVSTLEGQLLGLAAGYRAIELAGATSTSNPYASMTPTQVTASAPSLGTALGDEQRGTPQGEVMEWIENFLKDTAGIVIPTADTGKVTQAAAAWTTYSSQLVTAKSTLTAALPTTLAAEFPQHNDVAAVQSKLAELIQNLADDATSLSEGCTSYATNVESIRAELLAMLGQLALEVAIDIGVGIALSFITFGAGAVAGAAKAAATIARWIPKIVALLQRLKTLIMSARRTMAVMRRAGIEALRSTVSGTVANAGASLAFGNFSWEGLGGAAISSSISGVVSGPFSHIGSNIASRGTRITVRSGVDGVTGGLGGVGGEFVASQVTGQDFNLLMAAVVGTAGGAAGGGLSSIRNPSARLPVTTATPPSTGGTTAVTTTGGGSPSTGGTAVNTGTTPGGAPTGGAPTATAPAAGGGGAPPMGDGGSGTPGGAAGNGGAGNAGVVDAGGADVPHSDVEVPASLPQDTPAGGGGTQTDGGSVAPTTDVDAGGTPGTDATSIPDSNVEVPSSLANDGPAGGGESNPGDSGWTPESDHNGWTPEADANGWTPEADANGWTPDADGPATTQTDAGGGTQTDVTNASDVNTTTDTGNTDVGGRPAVAGGAGSMGAGMHAIHPDGPTHTTHPDGPDGTDSPTNTNDPDGSDEPAQNDLDGDDVGAGDNPDPNSSNDEPGTPGDNPNGTEYAAGNGGDGPTGSGDVNNGSNPPHNDPAWVHHPASLAPIRPELEVILDGSDAGGPGWHRGEDVAPEPPNPGERPGLLNGNYGPIVDANGHATQVGDAATLLGADPSAPYGHKPDGTPYTDGADWSRDHVAAVHGQTYGDMKWAPNDGVVPGTRVQFTDLNAFRDAAGNLHIDRLGRADTGTYMGLGGGTFGERGLPPAQLKQNEFWHIDLDPNAVLPDGWNLEVSRIAPAYGQPGGGLQIVVHDATGRNVPVGELAKQDIFVVTAHEYND